MFNLKIGGISAGFAFILSFIIGLAGSTTMPLLLIRPIIFAVLFFIISNVGYFLVSQFLPELLEEGGPDLDKTPLPGSRINITEGDYTGLPQGNNPPSPRPAFMGAQADDSDEGMGNITDLLKRATLPQVSIRETQEHSPPGLDQNAQDSYTKKGDLEAFPEAEPLPPNGGDSGSGGNASGFPGGFPEGNSGEIPDSAVDILPDLDSMAGAFLSSSADGEADTIEYSVSTPSPKPSSNSKTPAWTGDFNAKDLASGLRTILSKEKEG